MGAKQVGLCVLLCLSIAFLAGCVAALVGAGAGAAGYGYIRGELKADLSAGLDRSYDATLKALKQLGISIITQGKDALTAKVTARNVEDKKVSVKLKHITPNTTAVSIRIGVFGNQKQSIIILDKIKQNLQ